MNFKEGDSIIVINPDRVSISKGAKKGQIASVMLIDVDHGGLLTDKGYFYLNEVISKDIYESPLFKLMSELDEKNY